MLHQGNATSKGRVTFLVFGLALALASIAITMMAPIMDDLERTFLPVTDQWMSGKSILYDQANVEFYNPPWLLGYFMPLAKLPLPLAEILYTALSLCCVFIAILCLGKMFSPILVALAVINQPFLNMVGNGETDALPLLGIGLGYLATRRRHTGLLAASLFLMALKPNNILLVILLYLLVSKEWKAMLLPLGMGLVVSFFIGFDWPVRYVQHLLTNPPPQTPVVSIWNSGIPPMLIGGMAVLAVLGFFQVARTEGLNLKTLSLALGTGLVFSPYSLSAHYVMLIPAFLYLGQRYSFLAVLLYLSSWALLIGVPLHSVWLASIYPLIVLVGLWITILTDTRVKSRLQAA